MTDESCQRWERLCVEIYLLDSRPTLYYLETLLAHYTLVPYFSIPESGLCCGGSCTIITVSSCTSDVTGDIICVSP